MFDLIRIAKIKMLNGLQCLIQFINQRNSRWNIQIDNINIRYAIDVFDKSPKAVAMRNDDKPFA